MRFALLLVLLFASPTVAAPPNWCVRVCAHLDNDGVIDSNGTGCLLDSKYVITNAHVVGDSKEVYVRFPDWHHIRVTVVKKDKIRDLALLYMGSTFHQGCPTAKTSVPGQVVLIGGYGQGLWGTGKAKFSATYDAKPKLKDTFMWCHGYTARPGDSGGYITNKYGQLVGIIMTRNDNGTGGIRIEEIRQFTRGRVKWSKK